MRVLLVNDYGTASGGAGRQMLALRAQLRARGHAVRLLSSDQPLVPGSPIEADVACRGASGALQPYLSTWNPFAARALVRELAAFAPDVVHLRMFLWQLSPALLARLADVPTVYQVAVYKAICPTGLKLLPDGRPCDVRAGRACLAAGCVALPTWLAAMLQRRLFQRHRHAIDRVVALSADAAALLEANGFAVDACIPNGVASRPPRPPLAGPPLVAYAGRLAREKGVDTLIDAFARAAGRVPGAKLAIAGAGPMESALRERAAPLGDRVAFLGHLPRDELERRFDAAWVQAAPSSWREPFGNVATEAMMRGTALVASAGGGFADTVVDGETGLLVPPGDVDALARAVGSLLADRALSERLGAAARARALAHYAEATVAERFESLYRSMLTAEPGVGDTSPVTCAATPR